jgi:hypothetical protein
MLPGHHFVSQSSTPLYPQQRTKGTGTGIETGREIIMGLRLPVKNYNKTHTQISVIYKSISLKGGGVGKGAINC